MYKTLLQGGHYSHQQKLVSKVSDSIFSPIGFARTWLANVDPEQTKSIGLGGGAFVLAALIEAVCKNGTDEDKNVLRGQLDDEFIEKVKKSDVKGKQVLLDALKMS
jgi:pumilio homology domain family member 6